MLQPQDNHDNHHTEAKTHAHSPTSNAGSTNSTNQKEEAAMTTNRYVIGPLL